MEKLCIPKRKTLLFKQSREILFYLKNVTKQLIIFVLFFCHVLVHYLLEISTYCL